MKYLILFLMSIFLYCCDSAQQIEQNKQAQLNFEKILHINSKVSVCESDFCVAIEDCISVTLDGNPVKYKCLRNQCTLVY